MADTLMIQFTSTSPKTEIKTNDVITCGLRKF